MNSSSPVPFQYSHVAQPTSAEMWCSSRPERMGIISPCGSYAVRRRRLDTLVGRLPGKQRPLVAHVARLRASAVEVAVAVGEQRARRLGVRVDEERHDEDLGVPEDVVEVRQSRQAASADRHGLLGGVGRATSCGRSRSARRARHGDRRRPTTATSAQRSRQASTWRRRSSSNPAASARSRAASAVVVAGGRLGDETHDRQAVDRRRLVAVEPAADHVARPLEVAGDRRAGRRPGRDRQDVAAALAALRARHEPGAVERRRARPRRPGRRRATGRRRPPTRDVRRSLRGWPRPAGPSRSGRKARQSAPCARARYGPPRSRWRQ